MAYGDNVDSTVAGDTGSVFLQGLRVSNPVECGNADGQGGVFVLPGAPVNVPNISILQIQARVGDTNCLVDGVSVANVLSDGQTALLLNYPGIIRNSVAVIKDGIPLPINLTDQYSYSVAYGPISSTISFTTAVGTGELYFITASIQTI